MSGLGMLASAIGGAAGVVGQQAAGDIEQGRKVDLATEQANIDVQKQARIDEARAKLDLDYTGKKAVAARDFSVAPATLAASDTVAKAAATTQRDVKVADLTWEPLNTAARIKTADDAKAAHQVDTEITLGDARNKDLLEAKFSVAMSDPRVASAYASAMAAAGASSAQQKLAGQQLKDLVQVSNRAAQVRAIQDQLATEDDPKLRSAMQQQLGDLVSGGKDAAKFLEAVNRAQDNARDALKLLNDPTTSDEGKRLAGQQLRNAQALAQQAAALGGFNLDSEAQKPIIQQSAIDDLLKNPKTAQQFDAAFQRPGLAQQILDAHKGDKDDKGEPERPTGLLASAGPKNLPGSPGARQESQAEARRTTLAEKQASNSKAAKDAFAALRPDDAEGASRLQASPLFGYLSAPQKAEIQRRVMGR